MRLHAYEWGDPDAPPVVCLHGVTGHGGRFRRLAQARLSPFRVVALDLRGHGFSEYEPPWTLETHVEDIVETVAALGIDRALWIGHSFGGRLVMELIAHDHERVERAVLLDPAVWVPPPIALDRAEEERLDVSYASIGEAVEQRLGSGRLHHAQREWVAEELSEHVVEGEDGRLRFRYCQSAVVAAYGEMAKPPPPFETLRTPTLLVRGVLTDVVPEVVVDLYRGGIGDLLEVAEVPGGHIVLLDAFDETADAIERFFDSGR